MTALAGVGFDLREGEVLGLIGPNGSGKTTLMAGLAGLLPLDAGEVRFQGRPLRAGARPEGLFYLPDGIAPWPEQPLRGVAQLWDDLLGVEPGAVAQACAELDLGRLMDRAMGHLSKGERKRALLAVALAAPHPLLLLDEPFDGLDPRQTLAAMAQVRAKAQAGRTLLLSIHQLGDAARVCDRLVLLDAGRRVGEGDLTQLRQQAGLPQGSLEEVFLALT